MRVLTFLPRVDLQRRVEKALTSAQFVVDTVGSVQECPSSARFAKSFNARSGRVALATRGSWPLVTAGRLLGITGNFGSLALICRYR